MRANRVIVYRSFPAVAVPQLLPEPGRIAQERQGDRDQLDNLGRVHSKRVRIGDISHEWCDDEVRSRCNGVVQLPQDLDIAGSQTDLLLAFPKGRRVWVLILGLLGASQKGDLALVVRQLFAPFGEQDLKAVSILVHGHEDSSSPETGVGNNLSPRFRSTR